MRASQVRLIDEEGKLIGIMSSQEALQVAQARGLDLVEIHGKSHPPICKIMNYGKWKFETKKKEKKNKKNQNKVLLKEIQIRTRTDEGDIKIKLQKARSFLAQGHKVKINLRFFGREMAHKELGFKLLKDVEGRLSDVAELEKNAKMERRSLFTILAPLSGKPKKSNSSSESDSSNPSSESDSSKTTPNPSSESDSSKINSNPSSESDSSKTNSNPSSESDSSKTTPNPDKEKPKLPEELKEAKSSEKENK